METQRLNADILAIVCEFLPNVPDVLSISLTCTSMHVVAIRWLLLTRPVYLRSGPSILHFHSFLFADPPARTPYARTLHINLGQPQARANDSTLLLDIFSSCKNLEHVSVIFQRASFSTVADAHFLQAFDAIPNLRSFTIRGLNINPLDLLTQFRAPMRKLGLHSTNLPVSSRHPAVLEQLLPQVVVRTLEELELDQFIVDPEDDPQALVNFPTPSILHLRPYPAVRSLSAPLRGKPLLDRLQHLFPVLDGTLCLGSLYMRPGQDDLTDIRAANQRWQDGDADGASRAVWKKLDRLVCDAPMFYALGLRCPIRLAMIDLGLVREHGHHVADTLRENPVPHLKLSVEHDLDEAFVELFPPELAESLTHLTLCLMYSNTYGATPVQENGSGSEGRWNAVLDAIASAIRPLRKLTHLRVVVGVSVYVLEQARWPFAPWEEYAHSFRASRFNWEGTTATLARAIPSLQYVLLTSRGFLANWDAPADLEDPEDGGCWKPYERWYITHGWRVANSGPGSDADGVQEGEGSLVELHDDVAETIIRNEELVLSPLDEAALHLNYGWGRTPPPLSV